MDTDLVGLEEKRATGRKRLQRTLSMRPGGEGGQEVDTPPLTRAPHPHHHALPTPILPHTQPHLTPNLIPVLGPLRTKPCILPLGFMKIPKDPKVKNGS